jgi:transcriptional antiterminator RfaH
VDWYTINTKPHQEDTVERNLQRLGLETFCPLLQQTRVVRRRRLTIVDPLFPGYLFARFNLATHYRAVCYAQGVRKLVAFGQAPAIVDEEIIRSIKSRASNDRCIQIEPASFITGQVVRIQEGPLRGLEAVFEQEMSDHQRAVLLLRTLSYQPRVIVNLEHVVGY